MQTFIDTTTGQAWQLDDDAILSNGVYYSASGARLNVPASLVPGELPPPPVPTAEEVKAQKWAQIKAERDRRKSGGVLAGGHWFHSDDASRIQQLGLVMMGANMPTGIQWKTLTAGSAVFVEMTPTLAQQIFNATATYDQAVFSAAETHRLAMEASADPASYNFSTGWPATF